jgi:hypothetical protein
MGIAMRGNHTLDLDFPSVVWKPLVGQALDRTDLEAIDTMSFLKYDSIAATASAANAAEESEGFADATFQTYTSDGRWVELKEGGKQIKVNASNRAEYLALEHKYRLNEFSVQCDAIARGLATIVPLQLLPLFTPRELELMVCGEGDVDVHYLKANTEYQGCSPSDPHVQYLFQALQSFTNFERKKFLRFVWGRNRYAELAVGFVCSRAVFELCCVLSVFVVAQAPTQVFGLHPEVQNPGPSQEQRPSSARFTYCKHTGFVVSRTNVSSSSVVVCSMLLSVLLLA